jgi:ATP-binding cassette, subfamily B, bacterial
MSTAELRQPDNPISWVLRGQLRITVGLAVASFLAGLAEAGFLLVLSRTAFELSQGEATFGLPLLGQVSARTAGVVALAAVALRTIFAAIGNQLAARSTADVIAAQRRHVASVYLRAAWSRRELDPPGRLQELLTTYATAAGTVVSSMAAILTATLNIAALLLLAVAVDPLRAVAVVAVLGLLGTCLRPLRRVVRRQGNDHARAGMDMASQLSELSRLGLELTLFDAGDAAQSRLDESTTASHATGRRLAALRGTVPVVYTSTAYAVLAVGLILASSSSATSVAAIGPILLIMLRSLSYGQASQSSIAALNANLAYVRELKEAIASYAGARPHRGTQPTPRGPVGIDVDDLTFSHGSSPTLTGITLHIAPGEIVGIVGPSGSGKSTLVQLLLGLREPDAGSIRYGGVPLAELDARSWHREIGVVPQHPQLLRTSVADNIRFLRAELTDEAIERSARLAALHDEIVAHPAGYARQLGDGDGISGGQAQRLCIARALAGAPSLLVLDEPTSALDIRSEMLIRETLANLRGQVTIIVVAHRMSTLDICDRLVVLSEGQVTGFDSPAALGKSNAFYRHAIQAGRS